MYIQINYKSQCCFTAFLYHLCTFNCKTFNGTMVSLATPDVTTSTDLHSYLRFSKIITGVRIYGIFAEADIPTLWLTVKWHDACTHTHTHTCSILMAIFPGEPVLPCLLLLLLLLLYAVTHAPFHAPVLRPTSWPNARDRRDGEVN